MDKEVYEFYRQCAALLVRFDIEVSFNRLFAVYEYRKNGQVTSIDKLMVMAGVKYSDTPKEIMRKLREFSNEANNGLEQ